jgi:phage-related protein
VAVCGHSNEKFTICVLTNVIVCDNIFIEKIYRNEALHLDWEIEYYRKDNGDVPVEDFLLTLDPKLRAKAYSDIMLLKRLGINIRAPYSSPIKGDKYRGLFELRTKFSSDITRIFYFLFDGNTFVLLHGFVKKSNKTPERELKQALNYKLDYERRCQDE